MKIQNGLTESTLKKYLGEKAAADALRDAAMRKHQEEHHPKRVAIRVPTWNGKPVMPITSK